MKYQKMFFLLTLTTQIHSSTIPNQIPSVSPELRDTARPTTSLQVKQTPAYNLNDLKNCLPYAIDAQLEMLPYLSQHFTAEQLAAVLNEPLGNLDFARTNRTRLLLLCDHLPHKTMIHNDEKQKDYDSTLSLILMIIGIQHPNGSPAVDLKAKDKFGRTVYSIAKQREEQQILQALLSYNRKKFLVKVPYKRDQN